MSQNTKIPKENTSLSAEDMQEANATGDNNNEQGQASFITGSTTGGGSNFGQGSSHLSGGSYIQGSKANSGSNYDNEGDGLGNSSTGSNNEGSSSPTAGAQQVPDSGREEHSIKERPDQDNSLKQNIETETDNTSSPKRQEGGSWSQSSIDNS